MIKYQISSKNPTSQFLNIQVLVHSYFDTTIKVQLPAWRAGRYQLADYAQNLRKFTVESNGHAVPFSKENKNTWTMSIEANKEYTISYEYHAAKMDAGSCWVDEQQIYINFVNCLVEIKGLKPQDLIIEFLQKGYSKRVCTQPLLKNQNYTVPSFEELADTTLLAAENLTHWTYKVAHQDFQIWIHGEIHFSKSEFITAHKKFTKRLIEDFGEFPESEYHFIYQILPYKHYHGVEHKRGTVITFGPWDMLQETEAMEDLIGVACHELYHAWNVCQIRPKELLPYNFGTEVYTEAGWMLEGITTYMGDLYLLKSGVYGFETYLKHFNKILDRESTVQGMQTSSILESSFDLWLDGYQAGIPDKKTSIYSHGALIAFALDLMLLAQGSSLPKVMTRAWQKFGMKRQGYSLNSFWRLFKSKGIDAERLDEFYREYIHGKENIFDFLENTVGLIGMELNKMDNPDLLTKQLGILSKDNVILKIHPCSPAYQALMIGDELDWAETPESIKIKSKRKNGQNHSFDFPKGEQSYYPKIVLHPLEKTAEFDIWTK
ncbi:M61 family peptidase [Algoriphagus namhaensis]|uniref:M61 family peptidase n=1 Tax=Algoriphagus namhaensis TaxID=915353 RepID=A0ABV8AMV6_9BACT